MEGTKEASACLRTISSRRQIQSTPRRKCRKIELLTSKFGCKDSTFSDINNIIFQIFSIFAADFYNNKVELAFKIRELSINYE
jgi:predicted nucleic acid-binding protein